MLEAMARVAAEAGLPNLSRCRRCGSCRRTASIRATSALVPEGPTIRDQRKGQRADQWRCPRRSPKGARVRRSGSATVPRCTDPRPIGADGCGNRTGRARPSRPPQIDLVRTRRRCRDRRGEQVGAVAGRRGRDRIARSSHGDRGRPPDRPRAVARRRRRRSHGGVDVPSSTISSGLRSSRRRRSAARSGRSAAARVRLTFFAIEPLRIRMRMPLASLLRALSWVDRGRCGCRRRGSR